MVMGIEDLFPRLRGASYQVTSPADRVYNCIAWAAGESDSWWWPVGDPQRIYWPPGVPREETLEAFRAAFATIGYVECDTTDPELGFERIVLFSNTHNVPTHAARQLLNGRWTSKLGMLQDIEHALSDLEGTEYGSAVVIMKRAVALSPVPVSVSRP